MSPRMLPFSQVIAQERRQWMPLWWTLSGYSRDTRNQKIEALTKKMSFRPGPC